MNNKQARTASAIAYGHSAFSKTFNCGQSTLSALLQEFLPENPANEELVKAASLVTGVGGRGETCGTVQGGIMFLGVLYGADYTTAQEVTQQQSANFMENVAVITNFANAFEATMGSTQCALVHPKVMGQQYDMKIPEERIRFYNDGADKKCPAVVETAIRLVCDLILTEEGKIRGKHA